MTQGAFFPILSHMRLNFYHSGRQFFFVTIATEGRARILSRLLDEKSRPQLLPHGEAVKAALLSLHGLFPCATVSDFVIMPDHLHFLLIANYGLDRAFNPLWATHRLMDAVEEAWNERGDSPEPPTAREMAERMRRAMEQARLRAGRLTMRSPAAAMRGFGGESPVRSPRWDRRCYIELSFDARQLRAVRRYIRLNPARALWKARHPDRFIRHAAVRHPVLGADGDWAGMGDLTLLSSPFLLHVRLTLRKTVEEHAAEIDMIVEKARKGFIPVCGFLSPGEKELLRLLKAEPLARFIRTVPYPLPPRYDPTAEDSRELAADRLLILSPFPPNTDDSAGTFRARCLRMNELAAEFCAKSAELQG